MNNKTKISAIGIIAFIVIVPILFSFFSTREKEEDAPLTTEESATEENPVETITTQEEANNSITDPVSLYESPDTIYVTLLKDIPIGIEKKTIHIFENAQENFPLPSDAGNITHISAMDDLNMIFFITDTNKLYSFSPIAKKYQEQKNIPEIDHTKIRAISTYLTYLYILQDDTIMRHTRIENGFDDGKKWLDEKFDFSNAVSMSINEEIFTTQNDDIAKFAKGTKQRYTKDTAIKGAHYIYATEDTKYVWVLDTQNATLFKTDKNNGEILDTFTHTDLSNGTSIAINEKEEIALISTPIKTLKFSLKK